MHSLYTLSAPIIRQFSTKTLIGISLQMSLDNNQTRLLWQTFMPRRKEISSITGTDLYAVQTFDADFDLQHFKSDTVFTKWAAVEVSDDSELPEGMQRLVIPDGLYAVFHYKGPVSEAAQIFAYIFYEWLPSSGYKLDQRPHFEVLGEKYSNTSSQSEEEIWIPVCQ